MTHPTSKQLRERAALLISQIEVWRAVAKCPRCGLPQTFRDFHLEGEGCRHCEALLQLRRRVAGDRGESALLELIEAHRDRPGTHHDAIVCWSGGKDSTYLLHRFQEVYGLRVLAVTVRATFLSQLAERNIARATERLGCDHLWLEPDPRVLEAIRFGFLANSGTGVEADVCDLCEGHTRKTILVLAIDRGIPMVVHGADPFQLIDFKLVNGVKPLSSPDACWPDLARRRGRFRSIYRIRNFEAAGGELPLEVYPFLYLPYSESAVLKAVNELELLEDSDPDETNCSLIFLINVLELLRQGFPAYIHAVSTAVIHGEISLEDALDETLEWLEEYLSGDLDHRVLEPLPKLGLTLDELIAPPAPSPMKTRSRR